MFKIINWFFQKNKKQIERILVIQLQKNYKRRYYKKPYSKKGYIAYRTNIISKLIDEGKLNLAKQMIDELIIKYPYDKNLILNLVRYYTLNQNYEEAINLLEELGEDHSILKQTALNIKLGNEDKVYELYKKYFTTNCNFEKIGYKYLTIYLNKLYNPNYKLDVESLSYTEQQIYSYSKEKALNHIKNNHCFHPESGKSIFDSNIDIEVLFDKVSEYIKNNNNGQMIQNMVDVYDFYYPNCGKNKDNIYYNCFSAYTFIGSKDILTMYPHSQIKQRELIYLEELAPKAKTKVKTGLERFNSRYSK